MIELKNSGVWLRNGQVVCDDGLQDKNAGRDKTIAYQIMNKHNVSSEAGKFRIKFDAMMSHDITYVGIIQTARASGLKQFPLEYNLTNCHNSLCAVGGTINEDDHVFGLSAAKKYGGNFVPTNLAVIHQYAREAVAGCGKMVLGSDSHTRYGALGTMGVGEGGPELVKQLLNNTYDIDKPQVVLVWLEGTPKQGVGPHDVAIAMCKAVFANGFVKNKVLEFVGPGIKNLSIDFRNGIDVMTTETTCLSSIWATDENVGEYYAKHGMAGRYAKLDPQDGAYYDSMIKIDLSKVECMIALPFHPSNAYTIHELQANAKDIFALVEKEAKAQFGDKIDFKLQDKVVDGKILVDQGVIAGCAGGLFENLCEAADILDGASCGNGYFTLSTYPASQPLTMEIVKNGVAAKLIGAGALIKSAFCGPCFGAGDVPANNGLSIRHTTRNFPNREGSKPGQGQLASVALMDARSIAATAKNGGVLTAATDVEYSITKYDYNYDDSIYQKRVYKGFDAPEQDAELKLGPNITDWPKMNPMSKNMLVKLAAVIHDPVTTTDELIPSGETSSYRSNPLKLSEFALSRRVPEYVSRSKAIQQADRDRRNGIVADEIKNALAQVGNADELVKETSYGSCVFATKPGDGSAREQAASCQKVLGGDANICYEFATKRYRSNCINWGIAPFTLDADAKFDYSEGDFVFVPDIREKIANNIEDIPAKVISKNGVSDIMLHVKGLTEDEKTILLEGCLMNYYAAQNK